MIKKYSFGIVASRGKLPPQGAPIFWPKLMIFIEIYTF